MRKRDYIMMNYATELGYTDRRAYEVIRVVTDKTIEVLSLIHI